MIHNQPYMPHSAVMPEYHQQMQVSPNQANWGPQTVHEQPAHLSYDNSHMHHVPYMHDDFHHMHHHHPMMEDYYDPSMHEMWDGHMHFDHDHHYDGYELTTLDYHHAWFHPIVHMHHHFHHHYHPIAEEPTGEKKAPAY